MLRKLIAVGLSTVVQVAALGAPLVHAHVDDHDHDSDHHGASVVHAHLSDHASAHRHATDGPGVGGRDAERAVFLQWFVAEAATSLTVPPAVAASFDLPAPAEASAHLSVQVMHGLDPPFVRSCPSRAPPFLLS